MLPLAGVRVIAIEQYGAGPFGSTYLADLGAEVIKIENPREGGELGRRVGPFFLDEEGEGAATLPGPPPEASAGGSRPPAAESGDGSGAHPVPPVRDSHFYQCFNRNKRSLALDLKTGEGQDILRRLAARSDGLLDNLRGDQPEKLGLTWARLQEVNPRIVCAHLSAYGRRGPRSAWPGFDFLMQAEAGHMTMTGEPDGPPVRYGISVVDYMAGLTAAFALVAGIVEARATGRGRDLDVSLLDVALYNLGYQAAWHLNEGWTPERLPRSAHASIVPCQLYRTRDGWIFIMCNKEKFWPALARALGRPEWTEDERFRDFEARRRHRELLTVLIDEALQGAGTDEWLERLGGVVPVAPVNTLEEALRSPHVAGQERILEVPHPVRGAFRMMANPIRVSGAAHPARPAPELGADTESLLEELGFEARSRAELRARGVVAASGAAGPAARGAPARSRPPVPGGEGS